MSLRVKLEMATTYCWEIGGCSHPSYVESTSSCNCSSRDILYERILGVVTYNCSGVFLQVRMVSYLYSV